LGFLLWIAPATASPAPQTQAPQSPSTIDAETDDVEELEQEVGDRDPTYLRTRLVFSYDHKLLEGSASVDRCRLKLLYAFGSKQRFGVSVLVPAIRTDTSSGTASGAGDAELQVNANVYYTERFRTGTLVQTTLQTSSDALIGGATTTAKLGWDFAGVLSSRIELTGAFYYKRSIHTARGEPARQFEPDIALNARVLKATWFVEWDSYYDHIPDRFAQTMKTGVSERVGRDRRWVVSAYYSTAINEYGRQSQYRYNAGFDATWYPLKYR
jgi:hypothetical protein